MPQCTGHARARRKKLFARISSTFINKSDSNSSILESGKMLHSKSTYFYRWGSRQKFSSALAYAIPGICGLALLTGGLACINPSVSNSKVFAQDNYSSGNSGSIALSVPDITGNEPDQQTTVVPGEVTYRTNIIRISATEPSNYQVYARAAYGYSSELKGASNPDAIIQGVGNNIAPSNFSENTWGYAISDNVSDNSEKMLDYNTLPNSNTTTRPDYASYLMGGDSKDLKVAFAARISGDWPSDHYQTRVFLSVVAIPTTDHAGFDNAVYMQDMTPEMCREATIGSTKRLIDNRSGQKEYWVAKLLDGNCWMTQNLDLDLNSSIALTPDDSDVMSNWTPTNTLTTASSWVMESVTPQSYDPGTFVRTAINDGSKHCTTTTDLSNASCDDKGWLNVGSTTGWVAADIPVQFKDEEGNLTSVDSANKIYDAHYLIGNAYSWFAATAESGNNLSTAGSTATSSICPKGWKLPLSGYSENFNDCGGSGGTTNQVGCLNNNVSGSFNNLLDKYGYGADDASSGSVSGSSYSLTLSPLYYVLGGSISNYYGLQNSGNYAGYNSSVTRDDLRVYHLSVSTTNAIPSRGDNRKTDGRFIRCVFIP